MPSPLTDFVAIDFETANHDRRSACAVGLAIVRGGRLAETFSTLIQPDELYFDPRFTQIHGITADDVLDAPTFSELWPELRERCEGTLVVAHNAAFDMSVLRACTSELLDRPELAGDYLCTYRLAKAVLDRLPNHRLNTVAAALDIPLTHHEALSDAVACAEIASFLFDRAPSDVLARHRKAFSQFGKTSRRR